MLSEEQAVSSSEQEADQALKTADSKKEILKATGILGIAQLLIVFFGLVRVKVLAVLLGAVGVGIAGLYQSAIDLIRSLTSLGLWGSAVRDIATSAKSGDQVEISETIKVLRSWVWFTGLVGMLSALVFSKQLSQWAFGSPDYTYGIAILSISILLSSLSEGQAALLQGLRHLRSMAKAKIGSAFIALLVAVLVYFIWGMKGIIPALLATPLTALAWNWHYSRRIKTIPVQLSFTQIFKRGKSMAMLGLFLSINALASTGTMFLVRSIITHREGLIGVGYFTAAWAISYMYLSAIFNTMSSDYYPRISAVQNDHKQMNEIVNHQAEVTMLITAPVIITMVTFIGIVVKVFYSKDFVVTEQILDWQLAGDFFKALVWPMGFVRLAKGKGKVYLLSELAWNIVYLGFIFFLWPYIGIRSTGVSFLIAFIIQFFIMYLLTYKLTGFRFNTSVLTKMSIFVPLLLVSFLAQKLLPYPYRYVVGGVSSGIAIFYSLSKLRTMLPMERVLAKLRIKKG